jgi:hypothetical protein
LDATKDALAADSGLVGRGVQISLKFSELPGSFDQVLSLEDKMVSRKDHKIVVSSSDPVGFRARLFRACSEQQWPLTEMQDQSSSLEEIFTQLKDQNNQGIKKT